MPHVRIVPHLLLLVALATTPPFGEAQDGAGRSLHWRDFTVQALLDADGRLHVWERQTMVFDGEWNGGERGFDTRLGQQLDLIGINRYDAGTGAGTPLRRGNLESVDEFAWRDGEIVRWRSRLESDPPFVDEEIIYELEYILSPVLVPTGDDTYTLSHDFAFPDRAGVIERFRVELTLDDAWRAPGGPTIVESAESLHPGRGYALQLPLRFVGADAPAAVPTGAPGWARALGLGGAILVPLLVFLGLRRRERELDSVEPIIEPESIDEGWLGAHIFPYPAEIVGAAWDRSVGAAEVAALLARLVQEGKLVSRVETDDDEPVMHLRRVAPLSDFPDHERELLEGLFFAGDDTTDTESIKQHYKQKGFDPASIVKPALNERLKSLPGPGRVRRPWLSAVAVILTGVVTVTILSRATGSGPVGWASLIPAALLGAIAVACALLLSRRVTHRAGLAVGVLVPLGALSVLLALLAAGAFEREGLLYFYRPGVPLILGDLLVLGGLGMLVTALAHPTELPERLAFRRRLVSARAYFAAELKRDQPRLQDAWFPYLLAFGLGPHIDRWFRDFGGSRTSTGTAGVLVATGGHPGGGGGSSTGGWSGGGPQFGGGTFAGGGTGGTWSMAAGGLAAGVSPPSSSSGGGGGSSSGGGSGGGW